MTKITLYIIGVLRIANKPMCRETFESNWKSLKGSGRKLLMGLKVSEFKRLNDIMTLCSINSLNGY